MQGEESAARLAGELLAKYAALDGADQTDGTAGVVHTGGGWYDVLVHGVPVDRVRGKQAVTNQYGHLAG